MAQTLLERYIFARAHIIYDAFDLTGVRHLFQ